MIENLQLDGIFVQQSFDTEEQENLRNQDTNWLKNSYKDDVWELKPHIVTDEKSKYTVTWNLYNLENYNGIFHRWDYWKNAGKELAYWIMEASESKCNTTSTLALSCRNIREFYEWLCFERHCFDLSQVKQEDIISFCEHISLRRLTQNSVLSKLIVISHSYSLRKYLKESLNFNPFKTKKIYLASEFKVLVMKMY